MYLTKEECNKVKTKFTTDLIGLLNLSNELSKLKTQEATKKRHVIFDKIIALDKLLKAIDEYNYLID